MIAKKVIEILARIRKKWIREHLNKLNILTAPWHDEICHGILQAQPVSVTVTSEKSKRMGDVPQV